MKKIVTALGIAAAALVIAPQHAHAGMINFATVLCSTGVTLTWADPHDTDGNLNNPPTDVYTMVIESVKANGVPVAVHTVDGLTAVMDPITATGVVTIEVMVHWHIERPDGTNTNSPTVPRSGTVVCNAPPPTTVSPTTEPPTTSTPAPTVPATTTVAQTTTSVQSGGVTVPTTVGPTTTRVSTDITLPETGANTSGPTVLATVFLVVGAAAFFTTRRRRPA